MRQHVVGLNRLRDPVVIDDEIEEAHEHERDTGEHGKLRHEGRIAALAGDDEGRQAVQECRKEQAKRHLHRTIAQEIRHQAWAELGDGHREDQQRDREDQRKNSADCAHDRAKDGTRVIDVAD